MKSTFHSRFHHNKQKNKQVDIKIKDTDNKNKEFEDQYIVIAMDSTGIKVTNRGQWMREKWGVRKKGYLKIHISVYVKTKKILSIKVTDELLCCTILKIDDFTTGFA